jgi:hypothetical protein
MNFEFWMLDVRRKKPVAYRRAARLPHSKSKIAFGHASVGYAGFFQVR